MAFKDLWMVSFRYSENNNISQKFTIEKKLSGNE